MVSYSVFMASSSASSVERSVESSLCCSESKTCWAENSISIRFFPTVPESVFFSTESSSSASSVDIRPSDSLNSETISRFSFM